MIPPALGRIQRRRRQQGVHFRLLQVAHQRLGRFLERDGTDFRAPRDVLRAAHADEVRQGADGRQTLVAGRRAAAPFLAQLAQEGPNPGGREVLDLEPVNPLAGAAGGKGQEQPQGVAVAPLGVGREVALGDEVLEQEAPDPRPEPGVLSHGYPPFPRSARSAHWPLPAAQASCSGRLAWRPNAHAPGRLTAGAATSAHRPPADTRTSAGGRRRSAGYAELGIGVIERNRFAVAVGGALLLWRPLLPALFPSQAHPALLGSVLSE